jgi:hypothetical protein
MNDALDVPLHDAEQIEEIQLVADLMIAASRSDSALNQAAVDALLLGRTGGAGGTGHSGGNGRRRGRAVHPQRGPAEAPFPIW